jgi:hypothetical protein
MVQGETRFIELIIFMAYYFCNTGYLKSVSIVV